jgi:RimJ/RimL family protein N-acetyltransferase
MNFGHLVSESAVTPTLSSHRLKLRALRKTDSSAVYGMMSDAEVMRFWDWPAFDDPEVVDEIVAGQLQQVAEGSAHYWAACPIADAEAAFGLCDLSDIDTQHRRAEIGFLFARTHWGQGYAAEAMQAIIDHAFGPLGLERLWARFHAGNTASRALLARLGFSYEGLLKAHILRDGKRRDCEIWGRVR